MLLFLVAAGVWAGAQNALAGGGSFVTFPALMVGGLDPRAANIASTLGLFPGQIATSWPLRNQVRESPDLSIARLGVISLLGGAVGAALLLLTPSTIFARLVPWLVMFATIIFAASDFIRAQMPKDSRLPTSWLISLQALVAIYGGYFGGGIGFLMLALLTLAGQTTRAAAMTKNLLAILMSAAAIVVLSVSGHVRWVEVGAVAAGSIAGGFIGNWLLQRLATGQLRGMVVAIGAGLTLWLFVSG